MLWPLTIVFLSPFFLLILTKCTPQFWQPRSIFQWFVWLEAIMEMRMVDDSFSIWGQLEVNSEVTCSCNNNSTHVLDCVSQNVLQHFRVQRTRYGTSSLFRRCRKSNCISNSNAASKFFLPFHPQVSISCWEVADTYAAADIADASRFVSNCWWDGQWHPGNQFRIDYHHGSSWSNSISEFHSIPRKKDQTWKDLIFMPFGHQI